MMTIEEFRATGRDTEDLGVTIQDEMMDGRRGRVYCGAVYVELPGRDWPADALQECRAKGGWYLMIGNQEWMGNLADLEQHLYEFACGEGLCDGERA